MKRESPDQTPKRVCEWQEFSSLVEGHIRDYTIQQYGDKGSDMATDMSAEECIKQIMRYCRRFGKGARGQQEQLRDLLKIAHYSCITYGKQTEE